MSAPLICGCRRCMIRKGYIVANDGILRGIVQTAVLVLVFVAGFLITLACLPVSP